jgi:hypothetical protein
MPLPFTLIPGEVARSSEVNANFDYIMSILGTASTPEQAQTATELRLGARFNALLTGTHDTGAAGFEFFQLGWNADYNFVGGTWKFERFIASKGASAIRLGEGSVSFLVTNAATGDLNAQMTTAMKMQSITSVSNKNYIYLPLDWSFQNQDSVSETLGDYRLTYVILDTPAVIYDGASAAKATTTIDVRNYGITAYAKAVVLSCEATATTSSGVRVKVYQKRQVSSSRYGFVTACALGYHGANWGIVPIGEEPYNHQIVIERTAQLAALSMYIVGYLV